MKKSQEITDPKSCWRKATDSTRMFLLLDWDDATPGTIRFWAHERIKRGLNETEDAQIVEARALADEIEKALPEIKAARLLAHGRPRAALNPAAAWPFPDQRS